MNKCPKCNKQFSTEVKFCPVCGYTDKTNQQNDMDFYICPQCHVEYSYKIDHCIKCGYTTSNYKNKINNIGNNNSRKDNTNHPKCPKCGSTAIQMVPRKFSLLTGFATNKVDRVCVNCKHKW